MSNKLRVVQPIQKDAEFRLPSDEQSLFDEMIDGYTNKRLGAQNYKEKTVNARNATIKRFIAFTKKAPWRCDEDDFNAWCSQLFSKRNPKKMVATETQRKYQTDIQKFYEYISKNMKFAPMVKDLYGIHMRQIVTEENKIPHVNEWQSSKEGTVLTHEQIAICMTSMNKQIAEAQKFRSKNRLTLRRDKVMLYSMYALGLRNNECCSLDIDSFRPNPNIPEFGPFGMVRVIGKGRKGSGSKIRVVPVDHPDLPPMLEWYFKEVRPLFMAKKNTDPNEKTLFMSERGSRIKPNTLIDRFHKMMGYADLEGLGFTPHSLRRSCATHLVEAGMSLEYVKQKLGHELLATTQRYIKVADVFIQKQTMRLAGSLPCLEESNQANIKDEGNTS